MYVPAVASMPSVQGSSGSYAAPKDTFPLDSPPVNLESLPNPNILVWMFGPLVELIRTLLAAQMFDDRIISL